MDNKSLLYTKWKCQYHIVFITKYRKKSLYGQFLCLRKVHFHRNESIPSQFSRIIQVNRLTYRAERQHITPLSYNSSRPHQEPRLRYSPPATNLSRLSRQRDTR